MNGPGPTLHTDRLILRPPSDDDVEPWIAFAADPEVQRHLGGPQAAPVAWRGLCMVAGAWAIAGFSMFSVVEKATGRWIGRLGPWRPEGWPGNEVGWALTREAWGKGYATEGAAAAIDWAFETLGWEEVIHCIETRNLASQGVARRLGSTILRQGVLPAPIDVAVDCWGQSRSQWRARRR